MQASKVQRATIEAAAAEIGVAVDITTQNSAGTRHRVKLNSNPPDSAYRPACKWHREQGRAEACRCRRWNDERGDAPYQRSDVRGNDRRVNAVCWHGFRDFFRAVYRIEPGAVFHTAFDTWRGSEDFELRFRESGHRNIGSQMCPMAAAEACRCPQSGYIDPAPPPSYHEQMSAIRSYQTNPVDTYGADEADGAACRAMANALRATR